MDGEYMPLENTLIMDSAWSKNSVEGLGLL